jgi:hypothetical protein
VFSGTNDFTAAVAIAATLLLSAGDLTLSAGNIAMTRAALQSILKSGTGGLDIGTSIAADLRVLLNNVAKWTFRESDGALVASGGAYLHGAGELELIGALAAGSGGNDVLIDTLVTRTAGWILRILNNGTPLYTFPSAGTPTQPTDVVRLGDVPAFIVGTPIISASCGTFLTDSGTFVDVTNLSVTITTHGRPVLVGIQGDGSGNLSGIQTPIGAASSTIDRILRDATELAQFPLTNDAAAQSQVAPPPPLMLDVVAAGTYTYKYQAVSLGGTGGHAYVLNCKLIAVEL